MYEKMWRRSNYAKASELYKKHDDWPDRIHVLQALLLREQGLKDDLLHVTERVSNKIIRLRVKNNIFNAGPKITERLANKVNSDISSVWALLGLSEKNL